jgi:hypothetical protein
MMGVCVGVVVKLCSIRGHHPSSTVGVPLLANSMWCFASVAGYYLWERVKKKKKKTGRSFATRFREHKKAFRTASRSSNFAKHLIDHTHSFGPIHNKKQMLQLQNKGAHLNTLERFHIYTEYTSNNHLNNEVTSPPIRSLTHL